jgi:hypothetical protein
MKINNVSEPLFHMCLAIVAGTKVGADTNGNNLYQHACNVFTSLCTMNVKFVCLLHYYLIYTYFTQSLQACPIIMRLIKTHTDMVNECLMTLFTAIVKTVCKYFEFKVCSLF